MERYALDSSKDNIFHSFFKRSFSTFLLSSPLNLVVMGENGTQVADEHKRSITGSDYQGDAVSAGTENAEGCRKRRTETELLPS